MNYQPLTADWQGRRDDSRPDGGLRTLSAMSVQREELLHLVGELPEDEIPAVLDDVRRHLRAVRGQSWPPAWFGAAESGSTDVAARSEDLLDEGFGRSA